MHGLCRDTPVTAPIIPDDYALGFFNYITGYTMHALSRSQSMGMLQVIPGEGKTVKTIMAFLFPSIPGATTPTRLVSLLTIAYVQALGIHSCTYLAPPKPLNRKHRASPTTWCKTSLRMQISLVFTIMLA